MQKLSTTNVVTYMKSVGIEIIGVSPIEPLLTDSRYQKNIERICPNAKCVIVFANTFPQSILDACPENARPARFTLETLYAEGAEISVKLSRFLEKNGYRGVIIPAYLPVEMSYKTLGLKGDLNLKLAAVEAGLGSRGISDLLITPNYGPRVRLFGVITDADLKPTLKNEKNYCTNCKMCIEACPSGAISESGCNPTLCAPYSMKSGLPQIIRFIKELEKETSRKELFKKLSGLEMWNFWQALSQGSYYECFMCIQSCPVGKIKFTK
ncbi:MAG: epoxyqueuosine reductase [Candidatus Lokiarchaeota archaeon]|nr:epoxyqueuosine reductase [Candidatus Lokiarchaeota archaeon]